MGDENHIRTLGDYSKPSHEGYRNTIELPVGNNVCEIDRAVGGKLRNKNSDESWEIIENLALYDHKVWTDTKEFVKPVKAIFTPQGISKTHDRRLLELEDQINFLLKGLRPTLRSSTHIPHAYADAVYSNPRPQSHNEPPKLNPVTFHERTELTTSRTPEKVLIREESKVPVTKNVNSISLARGDEERSDKMDETLDNTVKPTAEEKDVVEVLSSRPVEYYMKHRINEKLIDNNRFNDSLSRARVGKVKGKTYNVLPRGPVYEAILKKKITKKEDIRGNFKIPCSIGNLKPAETDIRLSLASHSYIYPFGIAKDVLVEVVEHVYPVDLVILDIKENEKRPFILGTPFLTTAKATIKFDKGTITLRSGKSKVSFHRIPDPPCMTDKGVRNDIEPIASTMTVNRLVLEWEEKIKLHLEREMKLNQWRSKSFKGKHPTLIATKEEMDDEGEVTLYLMRRSLEVLRKFHWMILG
ncbi:MAK10-like protein [Tanacetum coccineum]